MELHYQPLFDCNNSKCAIGYEALMRWQHPTRGTISPAVFIPLAEEIGHIEALGTWAIRKACEDAMGWPDDVRVAVNLSSEQFREGATDVVAVVTDALQHSGLAPHRLELEITESLLMQDSDSVLDSLQRLTDLGVRLAMDDFGTGYSSLSYLWRFPFNKVKIDRAFASEVTEDQRVETIVSSIVSMAHSLGMRVNVEGIETHAQQQKLVSLGCDELQGFLLGKPEAIEKPEAMKKAG
jgi:EAL domain-containing protein (putative c-di-GMP-specific phosphodiesterase class I)